MLIHEDGLVIDDETGEIVESGHHPEALGPILAQRAHGADEQYKAWDATRRGYKAALMRTMTDSRASYPEVGLNASMRSGTRTNQDMEGLREQLETIELTRAEVEELLMAATGFREDRLTTEALQKLVSAFTSSVTTAPYVVITPIRQPAPKRTKEEVDA